MFETIRSNPEICRVQEDEDEEEEEEEEAPEAPLVWRGQPANKDKQRCREDGMNMCKLPHVYNNYIVPGSHPRDCTDLTVRMCLFFVSVETVSPWPVLAGWVGGPFQANYFDKKCNLVATYSE